MTDLASFVEQVCDESHLRVEADLGDGFVRLRSDEAQRRQAAQDIRHSEDVVIELLRNARDAHAKNIFLATGCADGKRRFVVIDDGDGIPQRLHESVFEPRVTSKLDSMHMDKWGVHGRGMALYSVHVNADEARIACSEPGLGTAVAVTTSLAKVGERADQSTFPQFILGEGNKVQVRGPRNILRTACEFALEHRHTLQVYVGSFSEVASALYAYGQAVLSPVDRAFGGSADSIPLVKRLAYARDCEELSEIALRLGLDISPRSARRIIDGEIPPAEQLLDRVVVQHVQKTPGKSKKKTKGTAACPVRFSKEDTSSLVDSVSEAFQPLAESYYLQGDVPVTARKAGDHLHIVIPLIPLE